MSLTLSDVAAQDLAALNPASLPSEVTPRCPACTARVALRAVGGTELHFATHCGRVWVRTLAQFVEQS